MAGSFWDEKCPARGINLRHVRSEKCPDRHAIDQCCHCEVKARNHIPIPEVTEVTTGARVKEPCGAFIPSETNRCRLCDLSEDDHPLQLADPRDGCQVDHRSLIAKLLISDENYERSVCPVCHIGVEPRAITGDGPIGPLWGKGRGAVTERLARKLSFVKFMAEQNGDLAPTT